MQHQTHANTNELIYINNSKIVKKSRFINIQTPLLWNGIKATSAATFQNTKLSLKCNCKLQNINFLRVNKN